MDPSCVRLSIFYGARYRAWIRVGVTLVGVLMASAVTIWAIELKGEPQKIDGLRVSLGLICSLGICHRFAKIQSVHTIRIYWMGMEIDVLGLKFWYPWPERDVESLHELSGVFHLLQLLICPVRRPEFVTEMKRRSAAWPHIRRYLDAVTKPEWTQADIGVRPWQANDWPAFKDIFGESTHSHGHGYGHPKRKRLREWFQAAIKPQDPRTILTWRLAIEAGGPTGCAVGHIDVWLVSPEHGTVEIAYGLLPKARHQGYARQTVHWVVHAALALPFVKAIDARVFEDNRPSIQLLLDLGFVHMSTEFLDGRAQACYRLTGDE